MAASQRYCGQLSELFKGNSDNLQGYIRNDHANSHGIHKGSATKVTSGTTLPPPTSSIAAQGEWSLVRILDIYQNFSEPGNHYLGRCLAGLDLNLEDFAILPPHFTAGNPLTNIRICEAVELMYGPALQQWAGTKDSDRTALFCKVLPSLVFHLEFLQLIIRRLCKAMLMKVKSMAADVQKAVCDREAWDQLQQSCFADRNKPLQQATQNGYFQTKNTTIQPQA
jgi:hypothetical protein